MKPVIIIPPDTMSDEDVARLNDNLFCVVVAKDPAAVRFLDPIPVVSSRTQVEHAAIALSRRVLHGQLSNLLGSARGEALAFFVEALTKGTELGNKPSDDELARSEFENARRNERINEARRLGREEAKAEREARKAATHRKAAPEAKGGAA